MPATDYMVDIGGRVEKVKEMVDRGNYFTINRPRQYGKTTLISALTRRLSDEYICARISFEGLGDESFENSEAFCGALMDKIRNALKNSAGVYGADYAGWVSADFRLQERRKPYTQGKMGRIGRFTDIRCCTLSIRLYKKAKRLIAPECASG